jgi:FtsH-binding integral membrane protein
MTNSRADKLSASDNLEREYQRDYQMASASTPDRYSSKRRQTTEVASLNAAFLAGFLILVGIILMADQAHMLPKVGSSDKWHWIILGIGGLLILTGFIRAITPSRDHPSTGRIIFGLILVGYSAGTIFGVSTSIMLPAALVVLGLHLFVRNLIHR